MIIHVWYTKESVCVSVCLWVCQCVSGCVCVFTYTHINGPLADIIAIYKQTYPTSPDVERAPWALPKHEDF